MGRAAVTCFGGCRCSGDMVLEGMHERRVSQLHNHQIQATQVGALYITLSILSHFLW